MGKPKAPKPPDPVQTASAQTGTNIATAIANNSMGAVNRDTPFGSVSIEQTGTSQYTDPYTGQVYDLPQYTETTTLSPAQQAILDSTNRAQQGLADTAASSAQFLQGYLGRGMDTGNLPRRGQVPGSAPGYSEVRLDSGSIDRAPIMFRDAQGGDITRSYGPEDGFSADRQRVEDALMQRLGTQLDQDRDRLETRLANQGISLGSRAFSSAQDDMSRRVNDARLSAILGAGQEQSRLTGMARDRAVFENTAQGQAFGQDMANIQQRNAAQGQQFSQGLADQQQRNAARLSQTQANNAARGQGFQDRMAIARALDAQRAQSMQETFAQRNQPINEITALMSGSQVQAPSFPAFNPGGAATTDVAGLINQNYATQYSNYANQMKQQQGLWGSLLGAGATIMGAPMGSL